MQSPRSKNITDKPKAQSWLNNHKEESLLFLKIIEQLNSFYIGCLNGYVDIVPPQYRYNNKTIKGYTIVYANSDGSVKLGLRTANKIWKKFIVTNLDEFNHAISFMEKHKFNNFCFSSEDFISEFNNQINLSLKSDSEDRQNRLKLASKKPHTIQSKVTIFKRNPDVVAEVLINSKGICESCGRPAPFNKRNGNEPYLEVHHKKPLSKGGEDTVENAEALCPNCHREKHFG